MFSGLQRTATCTRCSTFILLEASRCNQSVQSLESNWLIDASHAEHLA